MTDKVKNKTDAPYWEVTDEICQSLTVSVEQAGVSIMRDGGVSGETELVWINDWEINRLITSLMSAHKLIKARR